MNDRIFRRILLALLAVALIVTLVHVGYVVYAYKNASIIFFIGKELW